MLKIFINGKEERVNKGEKLIEAIKRAGFYVPTLCYLKDKPSPSNPCGICIVRIEDEGIVRSCEYRIEREIKVITEDTQIKEIRKKLLENLISSHYGDCKAPCHTPCPGGLNIQGILVL